MNYIWGGMIIVSIVVSFFNGNVEQTINAGFLGAKESVTILLSFAGMMCLWTGLLKLCEKNGIAWITQRILKPVVDMLFSGASEKSKEYITLNITANVLGMGNAATPMGIKAMENLDKDNGYSEYSSKNMCMLVALNTTSFQLIPTTIISIRTAMGSQNPFSIIVPIWLASFAGVIAVVISIKLMYKEKEVQK